MREESFWRGAAVVGAFLAASGLCAQPAPEAATAVVPKRLVTSERFMVVAAHPLAARAGYDAIRRGGSAVDAAIAVELVLGLVEPQSSGLGGGGFLLHYAAREAKLEAYDGRETAPASAKPGRFLGADKRPLDWPDAVISGKSVGVPGLLRLLELAHRRHGKLPWASLFEPAIRLAREGFPISPRLSALVAADRFLPLDANARRYFYLPDGKAKPAGTLLKNPEYATVLERVAAGGADAFYRGRIARDIAAAARSHKRAPGDLVESDFSAYSAIRREPLCGEYRRWKVCGMPPPSSGGFAVLQLLEILERFDLRALKPDSVEAAHLFAESGRLAYADRNLYIADPDFVRAPLAELLESRYLAARAKLIDPLHSMGRARAGNPAGVAANYGPSEPLELPATSHVSIADAEGNAVALTASIESAFGNRQMVRGFFLNNELTDFSWAPEEDGKPVANRVEAKKRPRSSMAPTLVFDEKGKLHMVIGSPGGHSIINYVALTLVNVLDWNMDIQKAIDAPRMGSRNGPTELERGTKAERLAPVLERMGHSVRIRPEASGLHGIVRTARGWAGGADPRREGVALGD
ncbi:MAG: gamma-glutamyltransferase [Betaproteobacteria bacterium]|nr:MAG: gamma-glutamyltransferase [Betaproteobacteria bacterium]